MIRKVVFNSWHGAFFNPGGGEVQLQRSRDALGALGYDICLYDMWQPQRDVDLLHQFSISHGVEHVVNGYLDIGVPVALSTIMWTLPPREHCFFDHVKQLFTRADLLLTNSDMESDRLAEAFGIDRSKFHKTRNGISDEYLDTDTDSDFMTTYGIDAPFVLSVANIDSRKNTAALVEACSRSGLDLVLVGHIRERGYYESFAGRYERCRYIGALDDVSMLKSAYQQCQMFALPSICETPGIAAMEAASQGASIVITSEGSTREYFGELVTYVDPADTDGIAAGLERVAATDADAELARRIIARYTWDRTAEDIRSAYDSL